MKVRFCQMVHQFRPLAPHQSCQARYQMLISQPRLKRLAPRLTPIFNELVEMVFLRSCQRLSSRIQIVSWWRHMLPPHLPPTPKQILLKITKKTRVATHSMPVWLSTNRSLASLSSTQLRPFKKSSNHERCTAKRTWPQKGMQSPKDTQALPAVWHKTKQWQLAWVEEWSSMINSSSKWLKTGEELRPFIRLRIFKRQTVRVTHTWEVIIMVNRLLFQFASPIQAHQSIKQVLTTSRQ